MNRRGFFASLAGAAAGVIVGPELAELLVPKRTIFLPPAGGWIGANRLLLTHELIAKEALRVLEVNTAFLVTHAWDGPGLYDVSVDVGPQIKVGDRITIARPPRYR